MRNNNPNITEEHLDFIREMMNVGAGNASTALNQMLQCPVDLIIPKVHILPAAKVASILDNPASLVLCVRMEIVGDIAGDMFFIVPEEFRKKLISLAEKPLPGRYKLNGQKQKEGDLSAIVEIGNILSGVYLTAIHDFCGLNVYHTVPALAIDMIQPLLDESLIKTSIQLQTTIMIENEFVVEDHHSKTLLLIIPSAESIEPMISSFKQAKRAYGSA
jgi:chemotaxis protein CheC